ncbi:MAG TPA: type I-E CRISPR-associated protein Cas6/Cse3/CasE [Methanomassiliicoccales archaeon]
MNRSVRRDLADPYELHRTIMRAFPSAEAGGPGRVLFRLEGELERPIIIVQSTVEAKWGSLPLAGGYLSSPPLQKSFDPEVVAGQVLRFRLRANPTVKREMKRIFLFDYEDQVYWLDRKATTGGFSVIQLTSIRSKLEPMSPGEGKAKTTIGAALFDGILRIEEPLNFKSTLESGIGSGKGFGFGLLSIAPIR